MANRDLCKSLGIRRLPCVHFYYGPEGKIEDFVCGPKKVHVLKEKLAAYSKNGLDAMGTAMTPVFDDITTDISKMYGVEAEQEEDVREASISDALKALVDSTGHDAAQDLDTVNTRIGWVLGQELVRDERRSRNATSADF